MIEATIELLDEIASTIGDPVRLVGGGVRMLDTDFRLYPVADIRDPDSDRCMIAYIDWLSADYCKPVIRVVDYPAVTITGVAADVRVSDTVETDDDGNYRYTPRRHPSWPKGRIGMVRVTLNTTGPES